MTVLIEGEPKEIAALALAMYEQRSDKPVNFVPVNIMIGEEGTKNPISSEQA